CQLPTVLAARGFFVLPPVGFGEGGEALAEAERSLRLLGAHRALLFRIARQVVELVGRRAQIEDVLPLALAYTQLEFVLRDIKIRARRMIRVEEAPSLPVRGRRHAGQLRDRRREIDVAADDRRMRLGLV